MYVDNTISSDFPSADQEIDRLDMPYPKLRAPLLTYQQAWDDFLDFVGRELWSQIDPLFFDKAVEAAFGERDLGEAYIPYEFVRWLAEVAKR